MSRPAYRYVLCRPVPFPEVMDTFDLALIAVQSLHGQEKTRLDARFASDSGKRTLVIDAGTAVGEALNQIFTGFARREFGEHGFRIERLADSLLGHVRSGVSATGVGSTPAEAMPIDQRPPGHSP